jgi:hypothetical protein
MAPPTHRLELAVLGATERDREDMVNVARLLAADDARRVVPQLAVPHDAQVEEASHTARGSTWVSKESD